MDLIFTLLVLFSMEKFGQSLTQSTKYLNTCSEAGGENSVFFMDENTATEYIMYNISDISNVTFSVRPNGYVTTERETSA